MYISNRFLQFSAGDIDDNFFPIFHFRNFGGRKLGYPDLAQMKIEASQISLPMYKLQVTCVWSLTHV